MFATVSTPLGPFLFAVDGSGAVVASGWTTDADALLEPVASNLRPAAGDGDVDKVTAAVRAYFDGDVLAIDAILVRQASGRFIERAWDLMRAVPAGTTITYTELAARAGRPDAVRAVGSACGRNACALFVPCHRILRTDGTLGGYRWGLDVKRRLLELEGRICA